MKLSVIKIGGSCITYKREGIAEIRESFLFNFIKQLKKAQKADPVRRYIIVHGGGSVTHPLVHHFGLTEKIVSGNIQTKEDYVAVEKLHLAMNQLNNDIVNYFLKENISVWPIQTSACAVNDQRDVTNINLEVVYRAMERNIVPIMHGDVVLDHAHGSSIASGDAIACLVARKMQSDHVVFFTDVDGVFEWYRNDHEHGNVIDFLDINKKKVQTAMNRIDYSGGMHAKLNHIIKYCCGNMLITICNGLVLQRVSDALQQKNTGTTIKV